MSKKAKSVLSLNFLSLAAILATAPLAATSPANASAFSFTQLDAANATLTRALGINDAGTITGYDEDASFVYHGFVRTADGAISAFEVPGAGTGLGEGTQARAINDLGAITGFYVDDIGTHGFIYYRTTP